ncbi:hypothetical protein NDI56_18320 [Haloarcula sp. S1CR25-12]|uniref:DNA-binding protein n=1 Tax=Haloarcula saliterrae TaxID=2950534 RepID=A0ABU2FGH0_9EURY|nr:hypothetical protein [Haloarcula sp. S1CR25-12]MDS0261360.1 hypothetical protein [Haloarcula sp. S1CR25-12]
MSRTQSHETTSDDAESVYHEYILDVRIVELPRSDGERRYRFEAPHHRGIEFDDAESATLYSDVYFDVNGFEEAGTGTRGVPPEIIQAGRDTLVAYFMTQADIDRNWVASYYGEKPEKVSRYVSRVRKRAAQIREGAREQGLR